MIKQPTVLLILGLAVSKNWPLRQLDVNIRVNVANDRPSAPRAYGGGGYGGGGGDGGVY